MTSVASRPQVVAARDDLAAALRGARASSQRVVFVPTMGALHEGHLSLVAAARQHAGPDGLVCVSVFVNPLQFGEGEDLDAYPRTLDADVEALAAAGVDVVWAPAVPDVYPEPESGIAVHPGPLGAQLEGAVRPTHFAGVLTVVATLLGVVGPDVLVLGEKDYQQLVLVRAMVRALAMPVEVAAVATHREDDGLARSSRNRYLSPDERALAAVVPQALQAGAAASEGGRGAVLAAVGETLDVAGVHVDYAALRTPDLQAEASAGPARLLVAVRIGGTRLIDNVALQLPSPAAAAHRNPDEEIS